MELASALAALDTFAHRLGVVWLHLKNLASANRLHTYLADLSTAIDQTIAAQNDFPTQIVHLRASLSAYRLDDER